MNDETPAAPTSDAIDRVASLLDFLGDGRADYAHGDDEIAQKIQAEVTYARYFARMLRDPDSAWTWLPSWHWDNYKTEHAKVAEALADDRYDEGHEDGYAQGRYDKCLADHHKES